MQYVNNWLAQLTAGFSPTDTVLPLPHSALSRLPSGEYLLTLVNSANSIEQTAWEIVRVIVAGGVATAARAQENTLAQDWLAGSLIYCSVTAGAMNQMTQLLASLGARVLVLELAGPGPGLDGVLIDAEGNTLVDHQGNALIGA